MKSAAQQWIDEGIEKGIKQGVEQGIEKIARNMLAQGADMEFIAATTGLQKNKLHAMRNA